MEGQARPVVGLTCEAITSRRRRAERVDLEYWRTCATISIDMDEVSSLKGQASVSRGSRYCRPAPLFLFVSLPILSAFRQSFNSSGLTGRAETCGFATSVLSENPPHGYRFSWGRTRTIHFRHRRQRSRFGTWRTHTSTRQSSHHQVDLLGDIDVARLRQDRLIAVHERLVPVDRDVGRQVPQGQPLVRLEAQVVAQPPLALGIAEGRLRQTLELAGLVGGEAAVGRRRAGNVLMVSPVVRGLGGGLV